MSRTATGLAVRTRKMTRPLHIPIPELRDPKRGIGIAWVLTHRRAMITGTSAISVTTYNAGVDGDGNRNTPNS
jgi:hypothetical protein